MSTADGFGAPGGTTTGRAEAPRISDDRGFPPSFFWAGIAVGLVLVGFGAVLALSDRTTAIYPLCMCIGFGVLLAAFGTRAAVRYDLRSGVGVVAGAGATAIVLYLIFSWTGPGPTPRLAKKIDLSGDLQQVVGLRIIDERPLYGYRTEDTRSFKFVILDGKVGSQFLRVLVDTKEPEPASFFEMRAPRAVIERQLAFDGELNWTFRRDSETIRDHQGNVIFRAADELDESDIPRPLVSGVPRLSLIGAAHAGEVEAPSAEEIRGLLGDLEAGEADVRRLARDRLAAAGPAAAAPMIAAWRASPGNYRITLGVTYALAQMLRHDPGAAAALRGVLSAEDVAALVAAVGHPDKTVRLYATETLWLLADPRAVQPSLELATGRIDRSLAHVAPPAPGPAGTADADNARYNSILVLKGLYPALDGADRARVAKELDAAVAPESGRTRGLVDSFIDEKG